MAADYPSIFAGPAAPESASTPAYVYGSFTERAGARILDMGLHYVVAFAMGLFIAILAMLIETFGGPAAQATIERMGGGGFLSVVGGLIGSLLYHTLCEGLFGSTAGKYVVGLVVLNDDGTRCTMKAAFKRSLAYFVDALFFGLIAWSQMKDSPEKKRIGDNWAETIVVKRSTARPGMLHPPLRFVAVFLAAAALDGIVVALALLL